MKQLLALLAVVSFNSYADQLPNARITPGKIDTTLTTKVICDPQWSTRLVRDVSESTKNKVYANYGLRPRQGYCSDTLGCEVDHLISLQLGGSNDIENLWPQPYTGEWNAKDKDRLENRLGSLVCSGKITLEQAQKDISLNWIDAFKKYGLKK